MFKLKSYLKFLSKNKLFTFINIFGLSVSLMFVILIANSTINEFTTDRFHENVDDKFVLANEKRIGVAHGIGETLKSRYPEIKRISEIYTIGKYDIISKDKKYAANIIATDSSFFDMFSFKVLEGDKNELLNSKTNIVISQRFARQLFGNDTAIGKSIRLSNDIDYTIMGIIEDFKNSAIPYTDIIIHMDNARYYNGTILSKSFNNALGVMLFVEGNIVFKTDDIEEFFKTFFWTYKNEVFKEVILLPLKELYFSEKSYGYGALNQGNYVFSSVLVVAGVLILIFSILNYINLTIAQAGSRTIEISIHRLLGAPYRFVFIKMIIESSLMCFVAFIFAICMAIIVEPHFNNLTSGNISILEDFSGICLFCYFLFVLFISVISGLIPALSIYKIKPINVIKGEYKFKSKIFFNKLFVVFQSVITIVLIACSITTINQVHYLINADLGYNTKDIINMSGYGFDNENQRSLFKDNLKQLPFVKNVGYSYGTPLNGGNNSTAYVEGVDETISFQQLICDTAVTNMFGIKIVKDNNIAEDGVWLNETALKAINGDENSISFRYKGAEKSEMIKGIIHDFVIGDYITYNKTSLQLYIVESVENPWNILIHIQGDKNYALNEIKKLYKKITQSDGSINFYSDEVAAFYKEYDKMALVLLLFTIVAIIISSLGLFAMSIYFTQQNSRVIAIRKVFGSTKKQILNKLVWQFLSYVIVAFIVACPIIWYAMKSWLEQFQYRINLSLWIFLVSFIFASIIAIITVYYQSNKAANTNPIDIIKK